MSDNEDIDVDSDADKRAHHNALERKRRDHIKRQLQQFTGLCACVYKGRSPVHWRRPRGNTTLQANYTSSDSSLYTNPKGRRTVSAFELVAPTSSSESEPEEPAQTERSCVWSPARLHPQCYHQDSLIHQPTPPVQSLSSLLLMPLSERSDGRLLIEVLSYIQCFNFLIPHQRIVIPLHGTATNLNTPQSAGSSAV
ncbi:hypothetical protein J4Q44_G00223490 [Coregonus suidteri]|uniref:BHLH domain-containing protein n=1 Tax=Coregonus suidteri TaxID=861788 RepID=A0AAN8LSH7_9TELE